MEHIRKKYRSLLNIIENGERFLVISTFLLIIFSMSLQIFCRYFLNNPLSWPEELSRLFLVWLSFLAASILYRRKEHIAVDTIINLFNQTKRNYIAITMHLIMSIFLILIIISAISLQKIQGVITTMSSTQIPKCYITLALTVSACSMLITSFYHIFDGLITLSKQK